MDNLPTILFICLTNLHATLQFLSSAASWDKVVAIIGFNTNDDDLALRIGATAYWRKINYSPDSATDSGFDFSVLQTHLINQPLS